MNKIALPAPSLYMTLQMDATQKGTAAARQRGAAATTEPGPGGSGPAALLPGTPVASPGGRRERKKGKCDRRQRARAWAKAQRGKRAQREGLEHGKKCRMYVIDNQENRKSACVLWYIGTLSISLSLNELYSAKQFEICPAKESKG